MEPIWVRSVYFYVMAFVGIVVIVFGTLGFALGIVHTAAPDLKGGDPFTSIATSLVNIASAVANNADQNGNDVPPEVTKGLDSAKSELHSHARNRGIDEMLRGLFMALIGLAVYLFHIRRTEAGRRQPAATPLGSYPPAGGMTPPGPGPMPSPPMPPANPTVS